MSNNQIVNKIKSNIAFKLMICFYKIISKKLDKIWLYIISSNSLN